MKILIPMDKMKYAVDKIEDNIVVLENIITGDIITVTKDKFSYDVKESDIVIYENGEYIESKKDKEERLKTIKEKMERLRKHE